VSAEGRYRNTVAYRALHVIKQLRRSGAEGVVLQLAKGLPDRCQVSVCGFRDGPIADDLREDGIDVTTFFPADIRLPRFEAQRRLKRLLAKVKPDIVHCHLLEANIIGGGSATGLGIPTVCHVHGPAEWELSLAHRTICRLGYNSVAARGARFIAVSRGVTAQVRGLCGVRPVTVYNGVDVSLYTPSQPSQSLREELHLGDDVPIVGFVGRLEFQKNPQCLVRSIRTVLQAVPDMHFVLVGDGTLRSDVERLASALGVDGALHLLGKRGDVPGLLPQFDVFALPTRFEGFGIVFAEAMACGVPVVTTDVVGANEVVVDGETGFLVPSDDHEAMAERIVQLLQDEELRKRMGAAGRKRVEEHFSIPRMIEQVVAIYDEMLGLTGTATDATDGR